MNEISLEAYPYISFEYSKQNWDTLQEAGTHAHYLQPSSEYTFRSLTKLVTAILATEKKEYTNSLVYSFKKLNFHDLLLKILIKLSLFLALI